MPLPTDELLQGTVDLLILRTLTREPMHGWAVSHRIQEISRDALRVNQGSLYPALHRLEDDGLVRSEWGISELGRRAKFYEITAAGKRQLARETATWRRFADAVQLVLQLA
jgi:PadR family transcriptional regulator, regulatory protein PadR